MFRAVNQQPYLRARDSTYRIRAWPRSIYKPWFPITAHHSLIIFDFRSTSWTQNPTSAWIHNTHRSSGPSFRDKLRKQKNPT